MARRCRWKLRPWAGSKKVGWVRSSAAALLSDAAGKSLKPSSRRSLRHRLCYWGVSPPSLAARTLRARDRKCQGGPTGHVTPEHGRHDTFRWFPPSPAGTRLVSFFSRRLPAGKGPGILAGSPLWPRFPPVPVGAFSSAGSGPLTAGRRERNCDGGLRGRDHAEAGA